MNGVVTVYCPVGPIVTGILVFVGYVNAPLPLLPILVNKKVPPTGPTTVSTVVWLALVIDVPVVANPHSSVSSFQRFTGSSAAFHETQETITGTLKLFSFSFKKTVSKSNCNN